MRATEYFFILLTLLTAYWFLVRPVLERRAALAPLFAREATFVDRCREYMKGLKTKLAADFIVLASVLVESYDFFSPLISGVDTGPLTAKVPAWMWPFITIGIAALFKWLRKITTGPMAA